MADALSPYDDLPVPARRPLAPATVAVTAGRPAPAPDAPLNPPIVISSTYHAGGPVGYSRFGNPTWEAFEQVLGQLEGGASLLFSSGMAAVAAVLDLVPADGVVVAPVHAYNGTLALLGELERAGRLRVRLADVTDLEAVSAACRGAALVWLESPTNPALEVVDLRACAEIAHGHSALVAVDNTFATPLVQQPLRLGADVVVHSVTKYLAGHSDVVLGATVARDPALVDTLRRTRALRGAVAGPLEAWLALRGLRTLPLRMERAQANAAELARRLSGHPAVTGVRYPGLATDPGHALARAQMQGFGAIVSLQVRGGAVAADAVCAAVRLWVVATSLGGVESTLERRRRWPAESTDIPPSLLRLSVGIEDVTDLWDDLDAALRATLSS
jgi:cystathionine gamma-synthase